ncbi:FAD-dependent oxidoreductase (plasmid) [Cytobacillus firmus]|uniref:NAD(P)/FAD-dependent oxidoreductase n=1 Tax=Cytobacillus firmus TaxID=1399 RepID=UPI002079804B|nr:FAD-dependent oxidoreductase [Cytobacillus firmus]USK41829.1 FAD-dependent oxidoreductase [Cytobacillus firmus]
MQKVIVIGGGVIGLSSAYYLTKLGYSVTVFDKGDFGEACSKGNQGWICPALHEPVPAPGLMTESFRMLLQKDSPLYIKPSALPQLSSWVSQFMKYCNERDFIAGETALLTLSQSTLKLFDSLQSEGLDFELYKNGILFAFLNPENLRYKMKRLENGASVHGHESPVALSATEVKELEPSLSHKVIGGILLSKQYHIRPESFSKALTKWLVASGANLQPYTEVIDLERRDHEIIAINTKAERIEADHFLIANGAWSGTLAKRIGYTLPLTAGKGYSITTTNPKVNIRRPIYLGDVKAGITPFNNAVRIGGTMELSGINTKLDKKRVQGIRSSITSYLNNSFTGDMEEEWTGMRPMTPDGLPVLGRIPNYKNLFVSTGHGMVGVAMAPATGKIMADLIHFGHTEFAIQPFEPNRFAI